MDILKANDYDLMLAGGYFRDMQQGVNHGWVFRIKRNQSY